VSAAVVARTRSAGCRRTASCTLSINAIARLTATGSGDVAGDEDGEEQRVEPALAHAGDVNAPGVVPPADLKRLVEEQSLGRVVVRVDDDGATMDLAGPGGHRIDGPGLRGDASRRGRK
jgi:hypothetical protein